MTLINVTMFLPYTIDFEVKNDILKTSNDIAVRTPDSEDRPRLSLFPPSPPLESSIAMKVQVKEANRNFFLSSKQDHIHLDTLDVGDHSKMRSIVPNEPYSPAAWEQTEYFTQPLLHTFEQLPPASVLQRDLKIESTQPYKIPDWSTPRHSRSNSYEQALRMARWSIQPAEKGNGGLINAVHAASKSDDFPQVMWVGTLGMPTDALDDERKAEISENLQNEFDSLVVYPKDSDFDGHYTHFCKIILWPVLHSQIPNSPKSKAYLDHSWVYYVKINKLFAEKVVKNYKRGDIIWIHDYHLFLVPKLVREKLPDAQIGFFLHVAFPSSEVFRCLAFRRELLEGLLGANLIGFQTQEYCNHFLHTCNRLLSTESLSQGVQVGDRFVNVGTFPIGIDPELTQALRNHPVVHDWLGRLERKYEGKKLIVARDKSDVRGIRQKLLAFERLLEMYPEFREDVVMIQVASSVDVQAELDTKISEIVSRINTNYSSLAHQPLVYLRKDLEYGQYIAMLESADILMITSLREGMNLSVHEYILCQDGSHGRKKYGSIILSEFVGSATLFEGHKFLVNPWDINECTEKIYTALTMSEMDKERDWKKLHDIVLEKNATHWIVSFLVSLAHSYDQHSRQHTGSIPRLRMDELASNYRQSTHRLFILDYEGTLESHGTPLAASSVCSQRTIETLTDLLSAPGNTVYIMSGQTTQDLDMLFGRVPGLGLIAENGCSVKHPYQSWSCLTCMSKVTAWKDSVRKMLEYYQERLDGSIIEMRDCSIFFNTVKAQDPQTTARLMGECVNQLNDACHNFKVHAVLSDGGLLVESVEFDKRSAAEVVLAAVSKSGSPDFLMVAGDAREDEVIYRWANAMHKKQVIARVCTVSVGSRNTEAMTTLTQGVTGVLSTLQKLAAVKAT